MSLTFHDLIRWQKNILNPSKTSQKEKKLLSRYLHLSLHQKLSFMVTNDRLEFNKDMNVQFIYFIEMLL